MRFLASISGKPTAATARWMVALLALFATCCLAVDRSKFRTCQQTSFCRRHRDGHSQRLYQYELLPESVHFVAHGDAPAAASKATSEEEGGGGDTAAAGGGGDAAGGGGGVWSSLSRRLLGKNSDGSSSSSRGENDALDPYVRGTPPTLTGTILNTATETTSSSTSGGSGGGGGEDSPTVSERLQWTVHAQSDGVARMRITEMYSNSKDDSSPYAKARVTYDDVVLYEPDTWSAAHWAEWVRPADHGDLLRKLAALATKSSSPANQEVDADNFMALQYGDERHDRAKEGMILLIRLKPFSVFLFRRENLDAGPTVVMGAESMMSFEIRRKKDAVGGEESPPKDDEEEKEKVGEEEGAPGEEGGEAKPEKEIVGYWEDGLAIYADGTREEKKTASAEGEEDEHRKLTETELDRQGMWEETFQSHTDSKPHGPMSVGMDISFPSSQHVFGIPEHASSAVLKTTMGDGSKYEEPYRLYNLDVFEYELDEVMALYGAVPMVVSQSATTGTTGVFWFNPTETFVDVMQTKSDNDGKQQPKVTTTTHWMSESGIVDVFLMPGPDPASVYRQYATLTGTTPLPPMFSLGYHQCRWNYKDEKDVYQVHGKFEELDYPYDVLWLDIEHTDGKRYFTWDNALFPNPEEMQEALWAQGRRMVTIIDPHIKRDNGYHIHKEATAKGLYIKDKDGSKDYDGWCWPGSSSYLDFTEEKVRNWWAQQFGYDKYKGSTPSLFTWNDMNEPSVFNGPEVSMQKDLLNLAGDEHREWHNLYGMLFHRATGEGQVVRNAPDEDVRPFVLSRAFFAGSQRYGAIWTGDNLAEWSHLAIAAPMLLSLNTAALSFVGADVGGFFGNPDAELFTRWMQAGAYQPFFRGHAHHDSKRREPWMFDEETMVRLRRAAMARYALLPHWYTLFFQAETTGMPVMRMMWMQYPQTVSLYGVDHQYMIGSDLLVHPVVQPGVREAEVLFPSEDIWFDANTLQLAAAGPGTPGGVVVKTIQADMDTIPVFQRGGSILIRKLRLRRSTVMMKKDPYTLYVALNRNGESTGQLYMDDEESFGYQKREEYALATFTANLGSSGDSTLRNKVSVGTGWQEKVQELAQNRMVERIVLVGIGKSPSSIQLKEDGDVEQTLDFAYHDDTNTLIIRKPEASALLDWTMTFS